MSLLSVTVKKARYVGIQGTQFNTYVTLKLQNVKSTTVTVKGPTPCWEQDFLFETNDINSGLLVEVWNKGVIWDRALGYHWLPLTTVAYANEDLGGRWVELEAHLVMRGGAVVGTTGVTGHALLLDCRFELPFDAEGAGAEAAADLQRKLDLLNGALDAERAELQARRQMQYIAHSGYSEDSDYTSDLNYPLGQHANCSASQFRTAAHSMHTPQRSLEVSRENSYEREEYQLPSDADPLYYNSRPRNTRNEWQYQPPDLQAQASVESAVSWRTAADWTSGEEQRRPSLERQHTLYDDLGYGIDAYNTTNIGDQSQFSHQPSYEEYFDSSSYPHPYSSFVGMEEHGQWDSGGIGGGIGALLQAEQFEEEYYEQLAAAQEKSRERRSSVVRLPQLPSNKHDPSSRYSDFNGMAPYRPPQRPAASLPGTPSSTQRAGRSLPIPPASSSRHRRLPRPPYPAPNVASILANRHVPYKQEAKKTLPVTDYSYDDRYEYQQPDYQVITDYNSFNDEDGMQPFFNETPHATPPAAQKMPWSEAETTPQFKYPTYESPSYIPSAPALTATTAPAFPHIPNATPWAPTTSLSQPTAPAPIQVATKAPATSVTASGKESAMLAGAQTLGLFTAGGAKKVASGLFGSLFGVTAPAPAPTQQQRIMQQTPTSLALDNTPETLPPATTVQVQDRSGTTLPRAPSLRHQGSVQRPPPVSRVRSLPDAPDDASHYNDYYPQSNADSYEDETLESKEEMIAHDRFHEEERKHDAHSITGGSRRASSEVLHRKASQDAYGRGSPRTSTVNGFGSRKPSVDSYSSIANDRRTSAQLPELHHEEDKPHVPPTEAEPATDKMDRASVQERTSYQEEKHSYNEEDEYAKERQLSEEQDSYQEDEEFHDETQKFEQRDVFREGDDYQEDGEQYPEQEHEPPEDIVFEEEQPKLTPRQRWHRAYNKIIRQLNVSFA